jgi:hypothetical protein
MELRVNIIHQLACGEDAGAVHCAVELNMQKGEIAVIQCSENLEAGT